MPGPVPYVVLSTQRAGSHLLGDILGSHPLFAQAGEVLIPETEKPGSFDSFVKRVDASMPPQALWHAYLDHLCARKPGATYAGFLVKYGHVKRIANKDLTSDPLFADVRIVHLVRRNILRAIASHHLAVARNVHVVRYSASYAVNSVKLDPRTLTAALRKKAATVETFRKRLAEHPNSVELSYEDLMDGDLVASQLPSRLCGFFEVGDEFTRCPPTARLAPHRLDELVSNYEQVEHTIKQTEFADMLD